MLRSVTIILHMFYIARQLSHPSHYGDVNVSLLSVTSIHRFFIHKYYLTLFLSKYGWIIYKFVFTALTDLYIREICYSSRFYISHLFSLGFDVRICRVENRRWSDHYVI